jgi:hypothetical protein
VETLLNVLVGKCELEIWEVQLAILKQIDTDLSKLSDILKP